jgi:large subunit ribosomal protein L35
MRIPAFAFPRCGDLASSSMPKQKTHKGTKKRFRLTASGKAKHRSSGTSHLAARMDHKRKRNLRGTTVASKTDIKKIRDALGRYSN